jgi:hypothetical protein
MKYDCVLVFHKCANLKPYFEAKVSPTEQRFGGNMEYSKEYSRLERHYERERCVRLILLARYAYNPETREHKVFCKIKCPINPFPVKGEFEAPSLNAVKYSLINLGWVETEAIAGFMLK